MITLSVDAMGGDVGLDLRRCAFWRAAPKPA